MPLSSEIHSGNIAQLSPDALASLVAYLEAELENIKGVREGLNLSLHSSEVGAQSTYDALKAASESMRTQAIGGIVSGAVSATAALGSIGGQAVNTFKGVKADLKTETIQNYRTRLNAHLETPSAGSRPVSAGLPEVDSRPSFQDHAESRNFEKFKEKNFNRFKDVDTHKQAALQNADVHLKEHLDAEGVRANWWKNTIDIATTGGTSLGKVSETTSSFEASKQKEVEAKAEQDKALRAAFSEASRSAADQLKRALELYYQVEGQITSLMKSIAPRA